MCFLPIPIFFTSDSGPTVRVSSVTTPLGHSPVQTSRKDHTPLFVHGNLRSPDTDLGRVSEWTNHWNLQCITNTRRHKSRHYLYYCQRWGNPKTLLIYISRMLRRTVRHSWVIYSQDKNHTAKGSSTSLIPTDGSCENGF